MTKAILDLCRWPTDAFESLLVVLDKLENYETEDVKEVRKATVHMNQRKLSRGLTMTIPNKQIILLSRMEATMFVRESTGILENSKSLKKVIENYEMAKARVNVIKALEVIAKAAYEEITNKFPNKFEEEDLDEYIRAEVFEETINDKGKLLKKYYDAVCGEKKNEVVVKMFDDMAELTVNDLITETDHLVIRLSETGRGSDTFDAILELVHRTEVASVLLFSHEVDQQNALMFLASKPETEDFTINQIFFEKDKTVTEGFFGKNLEFGLLCGKLNVRGGLLLSFNGGLHNLAKMCEQLTQPGDKICHVTEGDKPVMTIHTEDLSRSITYYCTTRNVALLKENLKSLGFRSAASPTPEGPDCSPSSKTLCPGSTTERGHNVSNTSDSTVDDEYEFDSNSLFYGTPQISCRRSWTK